MTFDNEEHKIIIAELVKRANFPGHLLEQALELKKAVDEGKVVEPAKQGGKRVR